MRLVQVLQNKDNSRAFAFDNEGVIEALTEEDTKLLVNYYAVAGVSNNIEGISISNGNLTYSSDLVVTPEQLEAASSGTLEADDDFDESDEYYDEDEETEGIEDAESEDPEVDLEDSDEDTDDAESEDESEGSEDEDIDIDDSDEVDDETEDDSDDDIDPLDEFDLDEDDGDVILNNRLKRTLFESMLAEIMSADSATKDTAAVKLFLENSPSTKVDFDAWLKTQGISEYTDVAQFRKYLDAETYAELQMLKNLHPQLAYPLDANALDLASVMQYAGDNRVLFQDEGINQDLQTKCNFEAIKFIEFTKGGSTAIIKRISSICDDRQLDLLQRYSLWLTHSAAQEIKGYDDKVNPASDTTQAHQDDITRLTKEYKRGHKWEYVGTYTSNNKRPCKYKYAKITRGKMGKPYDHYIRKQYIVIDTDALPDGIDDLYSVNEAYANVIEQDYQSYTPLEKKIDRAIKDKNIYAIGSTCIGYFMELRPTQKKRLDTAISMVDSDMRYIERILKSSHKDEYMAMFEPLQKILGTRNDFLTYRAVCAFNNGSIALNCTNEMSDLFEFYYQFTQLGVPYPLSMIRMFQLWITQNCLFVYDKDGNSSNNIVFHLTRANFQVDKKSSLYELVTTPYINPDAALFLAGLNKINTYGVTKEDFWNIGRNPLSYNELGSIFYDYRCYVLYKLGGIFRSTNYDLSNGAFVENKNRVASWKPLNYDALVSHIGKSILYPGARSKAYVYIPYSDSTFKRFSGYSLDEFLKLSNHYAELQTALGYGLSTNRDDAYFFENRQNQNTRTIFAFDMCKKLCALETMDFKQILKRVVSYGILYKYVPMEIRTQYDRSISIEVLCKG